MFFGPNAARALKHYVWTPMFKEEVLWLCAVQRSLLIKPIVYQGLDEGENKPLFLEMEEDLRLFWFSGFRGGFGLGSLGFLSRFASGFLPFLELFSHGFPQYREFVPFVDLFGLWGILFLG
jgi:hypothetical protein